ncbi:hypothetical protein JW859_14565 [bacterium]|nr:hypothetical protein [bacterium]
MAKVMESAQILGEAALLTFLQDQFKRLEELKKRMDTSRGYMIFSLVVAAILLLFAFQVPVLFLLCLIPIPFIASYNARKADYEKELAEPKKRIRSIKIGNIPVDVFSTRKKTYVFDEAGLLPKTSVLFPSEKPAEKLRELLNRHNQLIENLPAVLPPNSRQTVSAGRVKNQPLFAEERQLHDVQNNALSVLQHLETLQKQVPLMQLNANQLKELLDVSRQRGGLWAQAPVVKAPAAAEMRDVHQTVRRLEGDIAEYGASGAQAQVYDAKRFIQQYRTQIDEDLAALDIAREHSLTELIPRFTQGINRLPLFASYVAYCPRCNKAAIQFLLDEDSYNPEDGKIEPFDENGKMKYDATTATWLCASCDERTKHPLFIHRLLDEIIMPLMENLLQDNRKERVHYYNDAKTKRSDAMQAAVNSLESAQLAFNSNTGNCKTNISEIEAQIAISEEAIKTLLLQIEMFEGKALQRIQGINNAYKQQVSEIASIKQETLASYNRYCAEIERYSDEEFKYIKRRACAEEQARLQNQRDMVQQLQKIESNSAATAGYSRDMAGNVSKMRLDTELLRKHFTD